MVKFVQARISAKRVEVLESLAVPVVLAIVAGYVLEEVVKLVEGIINSVVLTAHVALEFVLHTMCVSMDVRLLRYVLVLVVLYQFQLNLMVLK